MPTLAQEERTMLKVYTTDTCPQCKMVKTFLKMKNRKFEEIDITNDHQQKTYLQTLTGYNTVPVTIKEGMIPVVGYNPGELSRLVLTE